MEKLRKAREKKAASSKVKKQNGVDVVNGESEFLAGAPEKRDPRSVGRERCFAA